MPKADQLYSSVWTRGATPTDKYAEFAIRRADAEAAAVALKHDAVAAAEYLKKHHGYSLTVLAHVTELHKNSLLRLSDPTWMPKPRTLQALDKLIVRADAKRRGEVFPQEAIKRGRPSKRRNKICSYGSPD